MLISLYSGQRGVHYQWRIIKLTHTCFKMNYFDGQHLNYIGLPVFWYKLRPLVWVCVLREVFNVLSCINHSLKIWVWISLKWSKFLKIGAKQYKCRVLLWFYYVILSPNLELHPLQVLIKSIPNLKIHGRWHVLSVSYYDTIYRPCPSINYNNFRNTCFGFCYLLFN